MALTKITSRILDSSGVTILGTIATGVWQGTAIADDHIASAATWNTASTDRLKWDGGATGLTASTGRTSLGLVIGTDVLAQRTFNDTNWDNAYNYSQVEHLPLAGGTLTGALSGTSATFSSSVTAGRVLTANNTSNSTLVAGSIEIQSYALNNSWIGDNVYFDGVGFKARNTGYTSQIYFQTNGDIEFKTSSSTDGMGAVSTNAKRLTIASTGAASFSSSVSVDGNIVYINGGQPETRYAENDVGSLPLGLWRTVLGGDAFYIQKNTAVAGDFSTATNCLQFTNTGAATFSSTIQGLSVYVPSTTFGSLPTPSYQTIVKYGQNNTFAQIQGGNMNNDNFSTYLKFIVNATTSNTPIDALVLSTTGAATFSGIARSTGAAAESTGSGAEIAFSGGIGYFLAYNRSTSTYLPVGINGSTVTISTGSAAVAMTITSGGEVGIGTTSMSSNYGKLTVAGAGISITADTLAKMQIGRYDSNNPYSYIKAGSTSSGIKFTSANDNLDILRIDNDGTIYTSNLLQANYGIGFPSPAYTSDPTYNSAATTLNAYEEGTWTPAFTNVTSNYTTQDGKYTRIGNVVNFVVHIITSGLDTTITNAVRVTLPYIVAPNVSPSTVNYTAINIFAETGFNVPNNGAGNIVPLTVPGTAKADFYSINSSTATNYTAVTYNMLVAATTVRLSGFYTVSN